MGVPAATMLTKFRVAGGLQYRDPRTGHHRHGQAGRIEIFTSSNSEFDRAIAAHDAAVAALCKTVWVGAEPTFTLPHSESPEWLSEPLGGDKLAYALRLMDELRQRHPGALVLRTLGRQYAAEAVPRWSIGMLERRDGVALWRGPADPLAGPAAAFDEAQLDALWTALERTMVERGHACRRFHIDLAFGRRLVVRTDGGPLRIAADDRRLARLSIHAQKTPPSGLEDPLAAEGYLLLSIGSIEASPGAVAPCIELPTLASAGDFVDWIAAVQDAATRTQLPGLVLQGYAPPVDDSVAWMTITPDPAVIEVNQAPQANVAEFCSASRELFDVASGLGLSPYRLQYNGTVSDSGGGGQFTLGGPTAGDSLFFRDPALLPRLVRYFNHHPALSYLFAPDYVGSASQSPRPDEGTRDAFRELAVACEQLQRTPQPDAAFIWASLAPFLADPSGNAHRSELNIEKLWNPFLPGRGCLGLVEFRAFRMPFSPERAAAIAALLRAIVAMLAGADPAPRLRDWGDVLHDRYALPFFLRQDLRTVMDELGEHGLGLGPGVEDALLVDPFRARWTTTFNGCELAIEQAVEFWPLVGDVASQEIGGSRMVDASTTRLQLSLHRTAPDGPALSNWRLAVAGYRPTLRQEWDGAGKVRLIGLRYRDFMPARGLHPGIPAQGPLVLTLDHPTMDTALRLTLHNWRPGGLAYDGLPDSLATAAARRAERCVIEHVRSARITPPASPPDAAIDGYTFDLRLCGGAAD